MIFHVGLLRVILLKQAWLANPESISFPAFVLVASLFCIATERVAAILPPISAIFIYLLRILHISGVG